ncbi:hypothetical protein KVT40_001043 [Elsinoe batatas]|uniref:RING-type domain-containing protein n=1 Tax=Elsinoe batatas TaxID=2601811 RepID=A0A8K0PLP0_9PEZI|nr:hypothetical protein KVT40_001043 [Elsinoe batatas]
MASGADQPQYSPSTYPTTHGVKRSHATMEVSHRSSISPLFEPLDDPPPPNRSHLVLPPLVPTIRSPAQNMAPPNQRRGLDYRRPVISGVDQSRGGEVVDLTNSDEEDEGVEDEDGLEWHVTAQARQRPRTSAHPVIDLSADSSPVEHTDRTRRTPEHARRTPYLEERRPPSLLREGSSDVMFMQIRQRQDDRRAREQREERNQDHGSPSPARRIPQRIRRSLFDSDAEAEADEPIDLTDDDDVIFVSATRNTTLPDQQELSALAQARRAAHRAEMARRTEQARRTRNHVERVQMLLNGDGSNQPNPHPTDYLRRHIYPAVAATFGAVTAYLPRGGSNPSRTVTQGFVPPGMMDYNAAAFDIGLNDPPRAQAQPFVVPPPKKAADGFTRSPAEDEVVVCPNCGDELALGNTDEKRSVWVVKGCGHVYCGHCILNRVPTKKSSGKGKQRETGTPQPQVKPFKSCVVTGCGSKMGAKNTVIQLFL